MRPWRASLPIIALTAYGSSKARQKLARRHQLIVKLKCLAPACSLVPRGERKPAAGSLDERGNEAGPAQRPDVARLEAVAEGEIRRRRDLEQDRVRPVEQDRPRAEPTH